MLSKRAMTMGFAGCIAVGGCTGSGQDADPASSGIDGYSCWDLDQDYQCDDTEAGVDGVPGCSTADCQGAGSGDLAVQLDDLDARITLLESQDLDTRIATLEAEALLRADLEIGPAATITTPQFALDWDCQSEFYFDLADPNCRYVYLYVQLVHDQSAVCETSYGGTGPVAQLRMGGGVNPGARSRYLYVTDSSDVGATLEESFFWLRTDYESAIFIDGVHGGPTDSVVIEQHGCIR